MVRCLAESGLGLSQRVLRGTRDGDCVCCRLPRLGRRTFRLGEGEGCGVRGEVGAGSFEEGERRAVGLFAAEESSEVLVLHFDVLAQGPFGARLKASQSTRRTWDILGWDICNGVRFPRRFCGGVSCDRIQGPRSESTSAPGRTLPAWVFRT